MNKKSKRAIQTLKRHLADLESIDNVVQGNSWKASLKDSLNLYLGTQSSFSDRLDSLYFTKKKFESPQTIQGVVPKTLYVFEESKKESFRDLIDNGVRLYGSAHPRV